MHRQIESYYTTFSACREDCKLPFGGDGKAPGWAPQPTNEVQRAIWDKVHAIPDKPLTIEFNPKKDK